MAQEEGKAGQAYTVFAKYYDEVMSTVPYAEWVDYLQDLLAKLNYHAATVLDLGCGTGNITLLLAKHGYRMFGIDGSAAMIEVAREKATAAKLCVPFSVGDFRTFEVTEPVELVICLYDSLNYLLTEADLLQAFGRVREALCTGGYFIFDLNTIKRLTTIEEGNSMVEGEGYYFFWNDKVEPEGPFWQIQLTIFEEQPGGGLYREDEFHTERGYSIAQVSELLRQAGFAEPEVYDAFTFEPGTENSERIYLVTRKKG